MRNIKLTIEYDGTHFHGWQIQGQGKRTVQGVLKTVLSKIVQHPVTVIGSGRTDSGVHALGQVAHFKTASHMTPLEIQRALNANLPEDIVAVAAEDVPATFHAQYDAKGKTYRYTILNRAYGTAVQRNFCFFHPRRMNVTRMRNEAKAFIGRKDFRSFQASDPARLDRRTVRTIKRVDIVKKGPLITIEVEADGFLYKMVRNIVGTLVAVGIGKLPPGSVKKILSMENRRAAGQTAPAHGLCLVEVKY